LLELALDLVDLFGQGFGRLSKDNLLFFFGLVVCVPSYDELVGSVRQVFKGGSHRYSLGGLR
jgi:hypothetical protein